MRDNKRGKTRSDRPSGRQASEQPEHSGDRTPEESTLHQGQGPDFSTQDEHIKPHNPGLEQIKPGKKRTGSIIHQQPAMDAPETVKEINKPDRKD